MLSEANFLILDEPTASLTPQEIEGLMEIISNLTADGKSVILITHNSAITPMADRVIHIKNGKVSKMIRNEHPVPVETIEW